MYSRNKYIISNLLIYLIHNKFLPPPPSSSLHFFHFHFYFRRGCFFLRPFYFFVSFVALCHVFCCFFYIILINLFITYALWIYYSSVTVCLRLRIEVCKCVSVCMCVCVNIGINACAVQVRARWLRAWTCCCWTKALSRWHFFSLFLILVETADDSTTFHHQKSMAYHYLHQK